MNQISNLELHIYESLFENDINTFQKLYLQHKKEFEIFNLQEEFIWVCENNFFQMAEIMLEIKPNLKLLFDKIIISALKDVNRK